MTTQTTQRSYTLSEIDRMRELIRWSYPCGVSYYPADRDADTENRLRTYMLGGVSLEELEKSSYEQRAREQQNAR